MTDQGPDVGAQFGPYLLKRLVGSGGMGRVFEAQDTVMDRIVALKLISGTYAQDPDYRKRLQREARIAGRLQDPHVVPIHAAGEIDGQLYVDMRLINGVDLDTMLRREGILAPARAVSIIRQVASALDAAHQAGVMHRDIKPGNILITADDFAYLVDFGIANQSTEEQLTQMGDVLGTWAYMAPERFSGDNAQVTQSSDIYALACVLFETLTGTPPYTGDRVSVIGAHISGPIPRASMRIRVPQELDAVIARGMGKRSEDRYATAGQFARAAEEVVGSVVTPQVDLARTDIVGRGVESGPQSAPLTGETKRSFPPQTHPSWPPQTHPSFPPQIHTSHPPPTHPSYPPQNPPPWPPQNQLSYPPQTPPTWHASPPQPHGGKNLGRWIAVAAAVVLVVVVAAGVGIWRLASGKSTDQTSAGSPPSTSSSATPTSKANLSNIDVGKYPTEPRMLPPFPTEEEGRFVEAFRLAEGLVNPYEIDPIFAYSNGLATPDPKQAATSITLTSTPIVQPVLEKYGMISAFQISGLSKSLQDFQRERTADLVILMLSGFPNADSAARAATEMDQTDFAVNPDNRHLTIPGEPDARAHYRPGLASIAATMARGAFVVSVIVQSSTETSTDPLIARVQKFLEAQKPLMDHLLPGPVAGLTLQPLDPDHMLSRMFVEAGPPVVSEFTGTLGARASALCEDVSRKEGLFGEAGVDRCATTQGSQLLRAKDNAAATALLPKLVQAQTAQYVEREIPAPANVPNVQCFEQKKEIWADTERLRFQCGVSYDRYVGWVSSADENDVRQRAASQFAILANSA
jgi:serine/threonine kinase PknH